MNRVSYRSDIVGFGLHMICMMYIYYDCSDPRPAPPAGPPPLAEAGQVLYRFPTKNPGAAPVCTNVHI